MNDQPYIPWPRWLQERLFEYLVKSTGGPWPGQQREADALLDKVRDVQLGPREPRKAWPRRGRAPAVDTTGLAFPKVAPGKSQAERREERNANMSFIRRQAFERAEDLWGRRCEFCFVGEAAHAHHVLKGSDRRIEESIFTLACIDEDCHRRTEESPAWARVQAQRWARRLATDQRLTPAQRQGFARTAAILDGRIALAEAQAVPVARGEEEVPRA